MVEQTSGVRKCDVPWAGGHRAFAVQLLYSGLEHLHQMEM